MTIHINLLSAEATFNFTGNKPAISAFKSAEVVDGSDADERSRGRSMGATNNTLVGEYSDATPVHTINWLAGVGDICNGLSGGGDEYQKDEVDGIVPPRYQMTLQQRQAKHPTQRPPPTLRLLGR